MMWSWSTAGGQTGGKRQSRQSRLRIARRRRTLGASQLARAPALQLLGSSLRAGKWKCRRNARAVQRTEAGVANWQAGWSHPKQARRAVGLSRLLMGLVGLTIATLGPQVWCCNHFGNSCA